MYPDFHLLSLLPSYVTNNDLTTQRFWFRGRAQNNLEIAIVLDSTCRPKPGYVKLNFLHLGPLFLKKFPEALSESF